MADNKRVVIIGGHGKVALLAAPKFRDAGYSVDSIIRNPDQKSDIEERDANPVLLDIEKATVDELREAFQGAAAVVFAAGAGGGDPERTHAVDYEAAVRSIDAAEQAGVQRYVMVSYVTADIDVDRLDQDESMYPYAKAKHDADAHLRASGLEHTILGPGVLTLEPASGRIQLVDREGKIDGNEPGKGESDTSRENVAEVMVHAVAHDAGVGEKINFYDGETPIAEAVK